MTEKINLTNSQTYTSNTLEDETWNIPNNAGGKPVNDLLLNISRKKRTEDLPLTKRSVSAETSIKSQLNASIMTLNIRRQIMDATSLLSLDKVQEQLDAIKNKDDIKYLQELLEEKRDILKKN